MARGSVARTGEGKDRMNRLSRRGLLRRGGGLALAGAFLGLSGKSVDSSELELKSTAIAYLAARGRAMDSGAAVDLQAARSLIAESNPALRDFADRDLTALHRTIYSHGPLIAIRHDVRVDGIVGNVVFAYERVTFPWKNEGGPPVPADVEPRARPTAKPVIESATGHYHRLELEGAGSSLQVRRDAFRGVAWDSPDVIRTAISPPPTEGHPSIDARGAMKLASPVVTAYLWDYAVNYCYTYWSNYNMNYYNYNGLGGDCTSFISQALANAGWLAGDRNDPNAFWYDAGVVPWVGRAWYNNNNQYPWILNNGRGYEYGGTPQDLFRGDIVYYDWNSSDGVLDHTVMVTTIPSSTGRRLVSGHNPDCNEVDWSTYWAPSLSPFATHNLQLYPNY